MLKIVLYFDLYMAILICSHLGSVRKKVLNRKQSFTVRVKIYVCKINILNLWFTKIRVVVSTIYIFMMAKLITKSNKLNGKKNYNNYNIPCFYAFNKTTIFLLNKMPVSIINK